MIDPLIHPLIQELAHFLPEARVSNGGQMRLLLESRSHHLSDISNAQQRALYSLRHNETNEVPPRALPRSIDKNNRFDAFEQKP